LIVEGKVNGWQQDIEVALVDFRRVVSLSTNSIVELDMKVEFQGAPHRPSGLPKGKMAVYCFWGDSCWLKIGKVGANSDARYRNQHYLSHSSKSNLAKSILADPKMAEKFAISKRNCKDWMLLNLDRCNILVSADQPKSLLSLLEAYLHHRLKPRFEG
jgi:hypothetical protein